MGTSENTFSRTFLNKGKGKDRSPANVRPGPRCSQRTVVRLLPYVVTNGSGGFASNVVFALPYPLAHSLGPVHLDAVGQKLRASVGLQLPEAQSLDLTCLHLLHVGFTPSHRFSCGARRKSKAPRPTVT